MTLLTLASPYSTAEEYRTTLGVPDQDVDDEITEDLVAVSRWIDGVCDRITGFSKDAAATVHRYYPWNGSSRRIAIDDLASTAGLIVRVDSNHDGVAEAVLASPSYELHPLNAAVRSDPWPYDEIVIPEWSEIDAFNGRTEVEGIHGWPVVPRAIAASCRQITGILRMQSPRATGRLPEDIDAVIETSPEAQKILAQLILPYKRGPAVA